MFAWPLTTTVWPMFGHVFGGPSICRKFLRKNEAVGYVWCVCPKVKLKIGGRSATNLCVYVSLLFELHGTVSSWQLSVLSRWVSPGAQRFPLSIVDLGRPVTIGILVSSMHSKRFCCCWGGRETEGAGGRRTQQTECPNWVLHALPPHPEDDFDRTEINTNGYDQACVKKFISFCTCLFNAMLTIYLRFLFKHTSMHPCPYSQAACEGVLGAKGPKRHLVAHFRDISFASCGCRL